MDTRQADQRARIEPRDAKDETRAKIGKIERALEIRKSSSKAREGKPLAFPNRRLRRR